MFFEMIDLRFRNAIIYTAYTNKYLLQLRAENLPADERVNVIGQLPKEYHLLLKNITNGSKIGFLKPI